MMMPPFQPAYGILYPGSQMIPLPMQAPGVGMPPMHPQHGMEAGFPQQFMGRGGGRGQVNVFYKTRMCNKWRSGACPFGDKCTYAHGQHELRRVPPEVLAQVEREQQQQQQMTPTAEGRMHDTDEKNDVDELSNDHRAKSRLYYKTRLCIRFMQSGYCVKGNSCTFAHGYEDLRLLGQQQHQQQQQYHGHRVNEHGEENVLKASEEEDLTPAQEKARAMSAVAGVGNAEAVTNQERIREATNSIEDGSAFRGGPYADSAEDMNEVPG